MKKITSTVLFIFLFASANANIFTDLTDGITNNKAEIAEATVLTSIAASAYYYEIKFNNLKVLKKIKRFIKNHPKTAAGILAIDTAAVGLIIDGILRQEDCLFFNFLDWYVPKPIYSSIKTK